MRNSMDNIRVTVRVQELLSTLRDNRAQHRREHEDAVRGWIAKAKDMLGKARTEFSSDPPKEALFLALERPKSHDEAYKQAIEMFEMHTGETIEIDAQVYRCYILDEWEWTGHFKALSASYSKGHS